jgi:hypothetical protein
LGSIIKTSGIAVGVAMIGIKFSITVLIKISQSAFFLNIDHKNFSLVGLPI